MTEFKLLSERRSVDKSVIDSALEIVKDFIIEHNLIIYGGQAIDYAMRLKGKFLYHDDIRPDFDCYSDDNVNLAYKLAKILADKNFGNISCIYGMHVQTMRVRVDFTSVCDISHIPKKIYEMIPTLNYNNMRIVHPYFQRIDMHFAFVYPYNPIMDDIQNRWEKDITRFNALDELYPIVDENASKKVFTHTIKVVVPDEIENIIYTGFVAYHFLVPDDASIKISIDKRTISVTCPDFHPTIDILSEDICELPDSEWRESWLDQIPERMIYKKVLNIMSVQNRLFAVNLAEGKLISNIQFTLLWFLYHALFIDGKYMRYYVNILREMEKYDNDEIIKTIYAPSVVVSGSTNLNFALIITLAKILDKAKTRPDDLIIGESAIELLRDMPKNIYLNNGRNKEPIIPVHEYTSPIYQRNG